MNGYECDGKDLSCGERWNMYIQRGEAKLNRTFHLSPTENMCTIARMKNIHYLF